MDRQRLEELKKKIDFHFQQISPEKLKENVTKSLKAYDNFFNYHAKLSSNKLEIVVKYSNKNQNFSSWSSQFIQSQKYVIGITTTPQEVCMQADNYGKYEFFSELERIYTPELKELNNIRNGESVA